MLSSRFHYSGFRPGQLEALLAAAHGKDVFVHMRTGGGKSLCMYLLPLACGNDAMGIVISPLVGLMEQQVSTTIINMKEKLNMVYLGVISQRHGCTGYSCQ